MANNKAAGAVVMNELHRRLAECFIDVLKADWTSESNPQGKPPAAYLNAARQMLKDNNVTADPVLNDPLKELGELPDMLGEDYEDGELVTRH